MLKIAWSEIRSVMVGLVEGVSPLLIHASREPNPANVGIVLDRTLPLFLQMATKRLQSLSLF